jgi:threonine synthase
MKYKSTRGGVGGLSFEETLFSGWAADSGLFVPEEIPQLASATLKEWKESKLTYPEVVRRIVRLYVSVEEIPEEALETTIREAYSKFYEEKVIPVTQVKDQNGRTVKIAELYHGRTGSFKDLALSLVGQFMKYFMTKRKGHVTVVVSTPFLYFLYQ